jgi:hypothetical protein
LSYNTYIDGNVTRKLCLPILNKNVIFFFFFLQSWGTGGWDRSYLGVIPVGVEEEVCKGMWEGENSANTVYTCM